MHEPLAGTPTEQWEKADKLGRSFRVDNTRRGRPGPSSESRRRVHVKLRANIASLLVSLTKIAYRGVPRHAGGFAGRSVSRAIKRFSMRDPAHMDS